MANQPEQPNYDAGVYQIETSDPVLGGVGGIANAPLLNLANRTAWLKQEVDAINTTLETVAPLASPVFTGSPKAPTPTAGDNSTLIPTTAFVQATISGIAAVDVAGGNNVVLSQAQWGLGIIALSGLLTGNISVIFPTNGIWIVTNGTTGGYTVTAKTATGSGVVVPVGQPAVIFGDGANIQSGAGSALQAQAGNYAVDTGWANAYVAAFTPAITAHLVGAPLRVKIANTNTGASTFNDGAGAASIVHPDGSALAGGDLIAGAIATLNFDGAHFQLEAVSRTAPLPNAYPGQCKVILSSATQLTVLPLNGDYIPVNGKLYPIPAAGITVANTNVEVSGTAGQNLAVSTDYLLFLKDNGAGTLIPSFYPLAGSHITDSSAGNVGVEVRDVGGVPDSTRTLVAMVGTDASGDFRDDATYRLLLNWFPEARREKVGSAGVSGTNVSQTAEAELTSGLRVVAMSWADEAVEATIDGIFYNGSGGSSSYAQLAYDNTPVGTLAGQYEPVANGDFGLPCSFGAEVPEGRHIFSPQGWVSAGVMNLNQVYHRVYIRG